jgi:multidrug efflux pump subunit AcrA (membrane-fusion protein)
MASAFFRLLKRLVVPALVLAAAVVAVLYFVNTKSSPQKVDPEERAWPVQTRAIELLEQKPTLRLFAQIESPQLAEISAPLQAEVSDVRAVEGNTVGAGELLVQLDRRDFELLVRQREADVADIEAQIDLERRRARNDERSYQLEEELFELSKNAEERAEDLAKRNLGSQAQLDTSRQDQVRQRLALASRKLAINGHPARLRQYQARLTRARALLDQSRLDLERTEVRSPFAGRIVEVDIAIGDRVRQNDALLSIVDVNRLELRAQIPNRFLPAVRDALKNARLMSRVLVDDTELAATLQRLSARVQRGRGGVDGFFVLDSMAREQSELLALGRTVELIMELPASRSAAIPPEAIYGSNNVYKLVDRRLRAITVRRVGERMMANGRTFLLIDSDQLSEGDQILATQLPGATEGLRVSVLETY